MLYIHYLYSICLLLGILSYPVMVFIIHKNIHATIQCLYSMLHLMIELPQSLKNYLTVIKVAVILKGSQVPCQVGLWLTFRNLRFQSVLLVKAHSTGTVQAVQGLLNTCLSSGSLRSQLCVRQWAFRFSWAFLMDISQLLLQSAPGRLTCICVAQTTDTAEELAYGLRWPLPHLSFPFWFATVINHSLKCASILSVQSSPSAVVLSLPNDATLNIVLHVVVVPSHKIIS